MSAFIGQCHCGAAIIEIVGKPEILFDLLHKIFWPVFKEENDDVKFPTIKKKSLFVYF